MAGIDSIINTRADAFANNPQGLMQRYAMNQDLLDLLALQKLKQDKEAAQRSLQMQMQAPQNTVKDQLQGQVMDMTRQEVAQAVAPGLQQQGQRMQAEQLQQAMGAGLGGLPAPAGLGMAQGGIVGYAGPQGSRVRAMSRRDFDARQAQRDLEEARRVRRIRDSVYNRNAEQNAEPGFWQRVNEAVGNAAIAEGGIEVPDVMPPDFWETAVPTLYKDDKTARDYGAIVRELLGEPIIPIVGTGKAVMDTGAGMVEAVMDAGKRAVEPIRDFGSGLLGTSSTDDVAADDVAADEVTTRPTRLPPGTVSPGVASSSGINALLGTSSTDDIAADQRVVPANRGQTQDEIAMLTALTNGVTPAAVTSQSTARAAPTARPAITALTEEGLAAFLNDMTARAQQPAQPSTEQPKYRSRYEDRLAEIEAEKNNRTSALIDFLLAAGASGGTNLGATLMGGGSGLRAREARLAGQEADVLKNIIGDEAAQAQRVFEEKQLSETIRANQAKEYEDLLTRQATIAHNQATEAREANAQKAQQAYFESLARAAENPKQTFTDLDDQRNAYVETAILGGDTRSEAVIANEFFKMHREADINARLAAAGVSSAQQREKMIADAYQKAREAITKDFTWISGKTPEEIDNEVARRALAQIEFTTQNMGQGTAPPAGTGGSNDLEGWGDLNVTSP